MTKRQSPESGFDTTNPSKRRVPVNASASHRDDPADSIQPNPSPHPVASFTPPAASVGPPTHTNGSATQHIPPATECRGPTEDVFQLDLEVAGAPADEDTFIPDRNQRNELAEELSALQSVPASTIDDPVEDPGQQYEESPGEERGAESIPEASPRRSVRTNKAMNERLRMCFKEAFTEAAIRVKNKQKDFYNKHKPLLWTEGIPDTAASFRARKSDALICGTTNITLDTEPLLVNGTIWNDVLLDELPQLLRSGNSIPLPPGQDKYDFLKACFRMGNFIEPNRMSRLLGGGYRSPEYCNFLLQGFLGLLYNPKVPPVLRGDTPEPPPEEHRDVVVYGDQLYPSDDELLVNQETGNADADGEPVPHDGNEEVVIIEESDEEEGDGDGDPPQVHREAVRKTKHKVTSEQRFFAKPSYVLRNYMSIVTGQQINDTDDFEAYCKKAGITFLWNPRFQPLGRLKWLKERMPAPELGAEGTVSEPLELWKHALRTYSVKNLSRCAVINVNPLLDWLGFIANEAEPATSEEEYFRVKRPVVAVAPVPLLYLADKAMDFVLRVLSVAVQIEELNPLIEDKDADHFTIDEDDVRSTARYLEEDPHLRPQLYCFAVDTFVLGDESAYNNGWPALLQRPLTAYESLELCDRTPKASISIPSNITEEMRAVVMSFRHCVKHKLYANAKMLKDKDPLIYMSRAEREESKNKRMQRNHDHGINWGRRAAENVEDGEDDGNDSERDSASAAKQTVNQRSPAKTNEPGAERDMDPFPLAPPNRRIGCEEHDSVGNAHKHGTRNLPKFFDHVNFAELIAFRIGSEELKKRKRTSGFHDTVTAENGEPIRDAALFLKESVKHKKFTTSTVCLHRLGWICLHALGIAVENGADDTHAMGYASSANYTNFGQLRTKKPVVITPAALLCLAQMADWLVRKEAEVLLACAAHDDGRPWIDRADIALVTSVRKEEFHYADL